jgi:hypothetical protein
MEEELREKAHAQHLYCVHKRFPRFAPYNGICFCCGRNIYEQITLERAKSEHITECPFCNRDFCD